jgi:hypothetical protein
MTKLTTLITIIGLSAGATACSSASSERQERMNSCEQLKEYAAAEIYEQCLDEARKSR